jgi:hypothetical protein
MSQTDPNDPIPQEDPIHDVPVYPEGDPPPEPEKMARVAAGPGEEHEDSEDGEDDVDEDDLDPQVPHSPPDVTRGSVLFGEHFGSSKRGRIPGRSAQAPENPAAAR